MSNQHQLNWDIVAETALRLGVSGDAIRKWRERGSVPGKWHLPIISASKGKVPASALAPTPLPTEAVQQ